MSAADRVAELEAFSKARVFHGTNKQAASNIQKNGFDVAKAQDVDFYTKQPTVLGRCVYFALDYFKAAYLAKKKFGKEAVVLEYVLDTGKMRTTGSACRDWQEEWDTCFLVGVQSKRKKSEALKGTIVQFDEIGVSHRVVKTNLQFIACYQCKKNKDHYKKRAKQWKQKAEIEDKYWAPQWYKESGYDYPDSKSKWTKKYSEKTYGQKSKPTNRSKQPSFRTPTLPDIVSTKNANYVSPSKDILSERDMMKRNSKDNRRDGFKREKSMKTDLCKSEKRGDTYYIYIPPELLVVKDNASAPAEILNTNDSEAGHSTADHEVNVNQENDSTHSAEPLGFAPAKLEGYVCDAIEQRAFRAIETANIPSTSDVVKSDPGRKNIQVFGEETEEEDLTTEEMYALESASESGSYASPLQPTVNNKIDSAPEEMVAPTWKTNDMEFDVPSFVIVPPLGQQPFAPALFANVINVGLPFQTINSVNYLASPIPVVFPPPIFPLMVPSPMKVLEPGNLCTLNSPVGEKQIFGVLGEKGC
jgi:hypothetical protein